MILAAGVGQRMRPLTDSTPKPLLCVGGKPLLGWHLERLAAAGYRDVVVNAAWLADQVLAFCGDGSRWGLRIVVSVEPEPLETAGGVINALAYLGDQPFLLVNGDVYTEFPFAALAATLPPADGARLVLVDNPPQHPAGDFRLGRRTGEVSVEPGGSAVGNDGGKLGDFSQVLPREAGGAPESTPYASSDATLDSNPDTALSSSPAPTLTYSGIGVYHPGFFAGLAPGKRPMLPLFQRAIAAGILEGAHFRGVWEDVGTPERLAGLDARLRAEDSSLAVPPAPE